MPKFIKFICRDVMVIINTDDLCCLQFYKETLVILITLKSSESRNEFPFKTEESFKIQCDTIMEQLEV